LEVSMVFVMEVAAIATVAALCLVVYNSLTQER
jgi:hypothetical protein